MSVQESLLLPFPSLVPPSSSSLSLSLSLIRPTTTPSRPHCTRPSANSARFFPPFFPSLLLHPRRVALTTTPGHFFGRHALLDRIGFQEGRKEGSFFARFLTSARHRFHPRFERGVGEGEIGRGRKSDSSRSRLRREEKRKESHRDT